MEELPKQEVKAGFDGRGRFYDTVFKEMNEFREAFSSKKRWQALRNIKNWRMFMEPWWEKLDGESRDNFEEVIKMFTDLEDDEKDEALSFLGQCLTKLMDEQDMLIPKKSSDAPTVGNVRYG